MPRLRRVTELVLAARGDGRDAAQMIRGDVYSPAMKDEDDDPKRPGSAAEWVAVMALIAQLDRDEYRELRAEAWDSVKSIPSSTKTN